MSGVAVVQPDLFGDYDRRERSRQWGAEPATCPACGAQEPSGFLLRNNHGVDEDGTICGWPLGEHPIYGARCVAQDLTVNHIIFGIRHDGAGLERDLERGRELGLDVDAIVRQERDRQD